MNDECLPEHPADIVTRCKDAFCKPVIFIPPPPPPPPVNCNSELSVSGVHNYINNSIIISIQNTVNDECPCTTGTLTVSDGNLQDYVVELLPGAGITVEKGPYQNGAVVTVSTSWIGGGGNCSSDSNGQEFTLGPLYGAIGFSYWQNLVAIANVEFSGTLQSFSTETQWACKVILPSNIEIDLGIATLMNENLSASGIGFGNPGDLATFQATCIAGPFYLLGSIVTLDTIVTA